MAALGFSAFAQAQATIKVGVLHSLSGTMAISETVLKNTVLMAIDEINAKGGLLGRRLEPVVVDPASNWPLFAEKAKQLIGQDKVVATFGCWTSVSRKSVLPVFEELSSLLFYPVHAAMLLFFRNETGFGGNNGFTDFKRILDVPIATPAGA